MYLFESNNAESLSKECIIFMLKCTFFLPTIYFSCQLTISYVFNINSEMCLQIKIENQYNMELPSDQSHQPKPIFVLQNENKNS